MAKMFTVYKGGDAKKGEDHTRANANDLVNGAGYTWKPNQKITPAAMSPHRVVTPPTPKEPAQAVLDAHGHNADRTLSFGEEPVEIVTADDDDDVIFEDAGDDADEEAADEPEVEASADEPTEEAAPRRRGRPSKT